MYLRWFTFERDLYAVVNTDYSEDYYKWADNSVSTDPEIVFEVPKGAKLDDGMFIHDWCYWWIDHIYGELRSV